MIVSAQVLKEVSVTSTWTYSGVWLNENGMIFSNGFATSWNASNLHFINWSTPAGNPTSNFTDGSVNLNKPFSSCPATSLIGRFGTKGRPFYIGERAQLKARGPLYLMVNDNPVADNRGKYIALIYPTNLSLCNSGYVRRPGEDAEVLSEDDESLPNMLNEVKINLDSSELLKISPNPSNNYRFSLIINDVRVNVEDIQFYNTNGNEVIGVSLVATEQSSSGKKI